MKFSEYLKEQLDKKKTKAHNLAKKCGVDSGGMWFIINDQRPQVTASTVQKIMKGLGRPMSDLHDVEF